MGAHCSDRVVHAPASVAWPARPVLALPAPKHGPRRVPSPGHQLPAGQGAAAVTVGGVYSMPQLVLHSSGMFAQLASGAESQYIKDAHGSHAPMTVGGVGDGLFRAESYVESNFRGNG